MHILVMEPLHESFRIREVVSVPGVTGPAAAVFRINVRQMPVHINDGYGERNIFFFKTVYEFFISLFGIFVKAAPPVAERVAGHHWHFSAQSAEVSERSPVIMTVRPEVNINIVFRPGFHPAVFPEDEGTAVVHHRESVAAYNAVFQRDGAVRLVERPGGSAQIAESFSVMPDAVIGAVVANGLDGQAVGGKWFFVIDEMCF